MLAGIDHLVIAAADGAAYCNDACPSDAAIFAAGFCGWGVSDNDCVGDVVRFAVENIDKVRTILFQPIMFAGRDALVSDDDRRARRYTLADLAHEVEDAGVEIVAHELVRDYLATEAPRLRLEERRQSLAQWVNSRSLWDFQIEYLGDGAEDSTRCFEAGQSLRVHHVGGPDDQGQQSRQCR